MTETLPTLIAKYKQHGILVDTNILLLYYVGLYDPLLIQKFKRTIMFTVDDFNLLLILFNRFNKIVTTPNVLTEVNSLANSMQDSIKIEFFKKFKENIYLLDEHYIDSKSLSLKDMFLKYGLTDTAITQVVKNKFLLLTDDYKLSQYLSKIKIDVINFHHIRTFAWQSI